MGSPDFATKRELQYSEIEKQAGGLADALRTTIINQREEEKQMLRAILTASTL
ncbi:hypothetical protein [Bradyrhizobium sp. AUGA SZCCT0169]|nr:hypothetical protein [Bradyrhizobium sp. AUGA SZCCT0169]